MNDCWFKHRVKTETVMQRSLVDQSLDRFCLGPFSDAVAYWQLSQCESFRDAPSTNKTHLEHILCRYDGKVRSDPHLLNHPSKRLQPTAQVPGYGLGCDGFGFGGLGSGSGLGFGGTARASGTGSSPWVHRRTSDGWCQDRAVELVP